MRNKVTIIIPTHNRTLPLARAIEYYSSWDCKIIICDSSTVISNIPKAENIDHIHYPNGGIAKKVQWGLESVKTPFACLCADDDFLSLHGVLKGVDFLEENEDYVSVQGRYIQFNFVKDFIYCSPLYSKIYGMHIDDELAAKRLIASAKLGMQHIYSLHRTDILKNIFSICGDINSTGYWEYNSNLVGMFSGKHIMLPIFWMARDAKRYTEYDNLPKSKTEQRNYNIKLREFLLENEEGRLYKKDFSQLYHQVTMQPVAEGERLFDEVYFNIFLPENGGPLRAQKVNIVRNIIKSLIPQSILHWKRRHTYTFPFLEDPVYKADWKSMERIIKKHGSSLGALSKPSTS